FSLLSFMHRPPPTSILFPYTTLFRSSNVLYDGRSVSLIDFGLSRYEGTEGLKFDLDYACFGNILLYLLYSNYPKKGKSAWYDELDRKSTRLNSSHVSISYAVFCLKKK